jgi:hypothetical protein
MGGDMGRVSDDPGGSEPGADAGEGIPYILRSGRLEPNRLALIDVILARPDAGLFERQLDLEALRRQDLPDGSARHPGVVDTGATASSITPDLLGFLGLQRDGRRKVAVPTDPEGKWEPTYAVQLVLGGAFYIGIPVTANLFPPEGQRYKVLIGCDVLHMCRLTYEGPGYVLSGEDAGGYTLHVPDSRRLGT